MNKVCVVYNTVRKRLDFMLNNSNPFTSQLDNLFLPRANKWIFDIIFYGCTYNFQKNAYSRCPISDVTL